MKILACNFFYLKGKVITLGYTQSNDNLREVFKQKSSDRKWCYCYAIFKYFFSITGILKSIEIWIEYY